MLTSFVRYTTLGIAITLHFKCMGGLFDSINGRTRAIKWGLVIYITVMLVLLTLSSALYTNRKSISFIDKRRFPGIGVLAFPGPIGYFAFTGHDHGTGFFPTLSFQLNQCLADGFLVSSCRGYPLRFLTPATSQLYRCYIVYSMNYWTIAIPSLLYLASVGMCSSLCEVTATLLANITVTAIGVASVYDTSKPVTSINRSPSTTRDQASYDIVCVSLNVLLTLMIVVRLVLHRRNIQNAMGASFDTSGLYKSIISMLIASCALYAGSFLAYVVTWPLTSLCGNLVFTFQPILGQTEVRADQGHNFGAL